VKKLIAFTGLLSGVAAAIVALMLNPLGSNDSVLQVGPEIYDWQVLEFAGNSLGAVDVLGLPVPGRSRSADEKLRNASAAIFLLTDPNGQPRALATRLSGMASSNNMLQGHIGVDTFTNIFWPNRGSVQMHGYENRWPLVRDQFMRLVTQKAPAGDMSGYVVSATPLTEQVTGIVGGSGDFAATGGRYGELLVPDSESPSGFKGLLVLDIAIR
jgi:hypothetical protein